MIKKVIIQDIEYIYCDKVKDDSKIRLSFDSLAQVTFDLSFENWYQNGYWQNNYIPHVLIHNDKVVANVSVNIIDIFIDGANKRVLQLGTIMTNEQYQNRGLSKYLINTVLDKWKNHCDCIYLYANDRVVDFYPKFGFVKAKEFQASHVLNSVKNKARKLDMQNPMDRQILLNAYQKSNNYSKVAMINNVGLLMFYCSQFLKDCVYYSEEFKLVVVAEYENEIMNCIDIFGDSDLSLTKVLPLFANENTTQVIFGFTPIENIYSDLLVQEDTTLFVYSEKENIFEQEQIRMPFLSRT